MVALAIWVAVIVAFVNLSPVIVALVIYVPSTDEPTPVVKAPVIVADVAMTAPAGVTLKGAVALSAYFLPA